MSAVLFRRSRKTDNIKRLKLRSPFATPYALLWNLSVLETWEVLFSRYHYKGHNNDDIRVLHVYSCRKISLLYVMPVGCNGAYNDHRNTKFTFFLYVYVKFNIKILYWFYLPIVQRYIRGRQRFIVFNVSIVL